jgi:phosphinothricin acetyltransferase
LAEAPAIRPAEEGDLPAILEIVNHAIVHTTAMYEYRPRDLDQQRAWLEEKRAGGWPVLVAPAHEGGVAGFGSLGQFRPRACYDKTAEHSVYVARERRGQGYGRRILGALAEAARDRGFHTLVGGVDSENAASLAFHRALGFEEAGRMREVGWKFDRWLTLVFMQKIL